MMEVFSIFLAAGANTSAGAATPLEFERKVAEAGGRVEFVFEDGRPFRECHASTLVDLGDNNLLCAWFGGTKEGADDVAVWMARFDGAKWNAPFRAAKIGTKAHWNPVLFRDPRSGCFLFFKVGERVATWRTFVMRSEDGGTWSKPAELVPGDVGGRGPVKNKPILLSDGAWLAGASTEHDGWRPFADRSEDGGNSWRRSADWEIDPAAVAGKGAIQPTLWESQPGHVHALIRTTCGRMARADSEDFGKTWTPVYLTPLPNNNSGIDAVRLDDGRVWLVYNPVATNWGPRTPLNIACTKDNGTTWRDVASLEINEGEYSYPAVIRTGRGLAVSYTWKRERIRCWQIPFDVVK